MMMTIRKDDVDGGNEKNDDNDHDGDDD